MALVNQDLVLDVVPGPIPPILHLTEYDENMEVVVTLMRRGQPFQIPTGTTVKIEGTLKGHPFSENGTPSGNTATFMVSKNMTAYAGRAWTKIVLTKDSKPVSSCGFWLDCDRAGVEADTVIGAPGFEEQINQAVADYLDESGFVIDPTLTISGAAADAKVAGDKVAELKSAIETQGLLPLDVNKFAHVSYTNGKYRYYESGELRANSNYSYSDYVVITPGAYCTIENAQNTHTTFYDVDHIFVSGTLLSSFLIPENAVYMVISLAIADQSSIVVKWTDTCIKANPIVITNDTTLADFNNAQWNTIYTFNMRFESYWYNVANAPTNENGMLITIDTNSGFYAHYAAHQIYITNTGAIFVRYYAPPINSFTEWESQTATQQKKNGVLYDKELTSENASEFAGSFSVVSGGYSITTNAILGKFYSVENRSCQYLCKIFSDSVVAFITAPYTDISTTNASLVMDVSNKTVKLNGFPVESCSFLTANHILAVEMSKRYQKYVIKITDMMTGDVFEKEYINNGTGGAGEGATGTANNVPMQYDYYGIKKISGTSVLLMKMSVRCDVADVVCYGDSITEPEAYWPTNVFENSWTQMLIKESSKKVVTSGRSGTAISKLTERIKNELPYIPAKYCMITIGTNGESTEADLLSLIRYIKSLGVVPLLNHIPCYDNNGDTTGFRTRNAVIDTVRANTGVKGCDFDLATSLAYDGQELNPNMMWLETYSGGAAYRHHPNVAGCAAMLAQLKKDVPEIF